MLSLPLQLCLLPTQSNPNTPRRSSARSSASQLGTSGTPYGTEWGTSAQLPPPTASPLPTLSTPPGICSICSFLPARASNPSNLWVYPKPAPTELTPLLSISPRCNAGCQQGKSHCGVGGAWGRQLTATSNEWNSKQQNSPTHSSPAARRSRERSTRRRSTKHRAALTWLCSTQCMLTWLCSSLCCFRRRFSGVSATMVKDCFG